MKSVFFMSMLILLAGACTLNKKVVKLEVDEGVAENDSVEYKLITFDSKFESWYTMHSSPATFRSQVYYENWNRQYVQAWNFNATQPRKGNFFEPIVGYEANVDYGIDINHKLFYYFQYVENVLKMEIMPNGPKAVVF